MIDPTRLLSLVLGCLLLAGAPSLRARDRPAIDVRREGDTFHVQARLFARVPPALAWEVLTDFEHMDRFVPNLEESRIDTRDGNRLGIVQRGIARFGPLAVGFQSERQVTLMPPDEIRSVQVRGSMRRMASITRFAAVEGGTELVYTVEAEPGTLFPAAITQRFLVHEIAEQFMAIADEMERRARK